MALPWRRGYRREPESLTRADIPPEAVEYRLGDRSGLERIIGQHRVTTDERSGITSDSNQFDDAESIVRPVGRVVRVGVETVRIIKGRPTD